MKKAFIILACLPFLCCGCLTHIVTVAPTPVKTTTVVTSPAPIHTTTVTTQKVRTVTTAKVTAISQDLSLYLDLQAIGAAFAQSLTVQDFEQLLNNSSYMLSNLDLNRDGYIDYLRVLETVNGYTHIFLIQAVLGANIYQDVATLVCEIPNMARATVQIIGSPFIYGTNYIVQPTFVAIPYIYNRLVVVNYKPWASPWYWNHYPTCYRRPAPIVLNHYQAYITTYMTNHHYCHTVTYPTQCHYPDYEIITRSIRRNDYSAQHPEMEFSRRTASVSSSNSGRISNARDIRTQQAADVVTTSSSRKAATGTTTPSSRSTTTSTPSSSRSTAATSSSQSSSRSAATTATSSSRSTAVSTPSPQSSSRSSANASQTTITSKVSNRGTATTRTTTTPSSRTSGTSGTSNTSSSRSAAVSSSSRRQ
ncbi:MAG: hypothetical protein MJZ64_07930 [Paludibacteraceae bacterium]|nr:hypothetical protein [Paludibacteraceae bacterium]